MNFKTLLKFSTILFRTTLKQLLNGNNGLLLILTPNNTDLTLTCDS